MVHLFINDMLYGGSVKNMIYSNVQPIPLWMNEGLAEFLANKWDANSEMWARDLAINGEGLPNMNQLNGYLAYRGGQSIWKFITDEWGEEIIAEVFWKIKKKGNLNNAIKSAMGINLEGLLKLVYDDIPEYKHSIAKFTLQAHLIKLLKEKKIKKINNNFEISSIKYN